MIGFRFEAFQLLQAIISSRSFQYSTTCLMHRYANQHTQREASQQNFGLLRREQTLNYISQA